jgi:solute:Na+ symporter, SSS family
MENSDHLSAANWGVILVYLLGIVAFGIWCGRGQRNTRDYFLGSKNIPWWGVGLSIVATETSALTFIGIPALAYGGNLAFIQIVIGYIIARILLAIFLVPHYFRGEIYSPYQLLGQTFGAPARRTAAGFFLVAGTLAAGVRVYVTAIPIQLMMGIDVFSAILLFIVLSLIYTYVGGIKAVVWTDAVQLFLLVAGGLFAVFYIPTLLEGGFSGALETAAQAEKLEWLNLNFSLAMPFNIWMGLIGATVLVLYSHGVDQLIVQRVLTCKSVADGRKALYLSAAIILPMFLVFLGAGVMLWVYYQEFVPAIPLPETVSGFRQNDYIFPIFILTAMPDLVKGLLIVAVLAAAMSSVSSSLSALASVSTMDIIRPLMKEGKSERFFLHFSKGSTVVWGGILILVAVWTRHAESVLNAAFSLAGLTSGAMLGGVLLVFILKRGRSAPVILGMLVSFAMMVAIYLLPDSRFAPWWERVVGVKIAWPWFTLLGTTFTVSIGALAAALLNRNSSPPLPEKTSARDPNEVLPKSEE